MVLTRSLSLRDTSTLAVRMLGIVGYALALVLALKPPDQKAVAVWLYVIAGLCLLWMIFTLVEWATHRDEITASVREAMSQHQRDSMYARVQRMKHRVSAFTYNAELRIESSKPSGNASSEEINDFANEQHRITSREFRDHLWIDTRDVIRECERLPYVKIDPAWRRLADNGPSSRGDIEHLFRALDDISAQLLQPLETDK